MKENQTISRRLVRRLAVPLVVAAGVALVSASPASAATSTPVVSGKTSLVRGEYARYSVSIPKAVNTPYATGNVSLVVDGKASGTASLESGRARFEPVSFTLGSHQIKVKYAGDNKYSAATSSPLNITVTKGSTKTVLIAASKAVKTGVAAQFGLAVIRTWPATGGSLAGPVTFTATPTTGTPITFTTTASATYGVASWKPKLPDGTYSVSASFAGTAEYRASTSNTVTVKVGPGVVVTPVDTDGDRLADSAETNTGVYVSPTNTGTDPNKADTDGDAISDGDEVLGTTAGLNLPALGFKALHKDLAFEFDWMDDSTDCAAHSHRVQPASIARIKAGYAAGKNTNPDGTTGVNFIADYGQGGAFTGGNLLAGAPADGHVDGDFTADYYALKQANFAANRNGYFHYNIAAHNETSFPGSAGVGQVLGDDLIVTQECFVSATNAFASIIFHEGGHNLGLRHGGFEDQNFKPNYPSTMNYLMSGADADSDIGPDTNCDGIGDPGLGYSSGTEIDLDENALIEANGVCGPGNPIDWNKNGVIDPDPIAFNLNPEEGPDLTVLKDYNDWANLNFIGVTDAD